MSQKLWSPELRNIEAERTSPEGQRSLYECSLDLNEHSSHHQDQCRAHRMPMGIVYCWIIGQWRILQLTKKSSYITIQILFSSSVNRQPYKNPNINSNSSIKKLLHDSSQPPSTLINPVKGQSISLSFSEGCEKLKFASAAWHFWFSKRKRLWKEMPKFQ